MRAHTTIREVCEGRLLEFPVRLEERFATAVEETMNATRGRCRYVSFGLSLLLSHHVGDCPRRSEIVDGASDINCQQHDRLRNRLSHVSVWLYSSKPDLHLCIRIQHPVLGQEGSNAPDPPATGVGTTETTMVNAPCTPIISERGFFVNRRSDHIIAARSEEL